ncbi:sterol desaturase family protein [Methylocapsa palsarum]|uniref:sterol desaturase family protein n=1 Tax=Methylocapsa palsarum TaxID=1612308 RepID=UPI001113C4E4|nr:sterol desaturase family protein [Methylocapsa palsarum]
MLGRPVVFTAIFGPGFSITPDYQNTFKDWPWYALLSIFLVDEDMLHYWWHRLGHTNYTWVWHRAHHSAPYMGVRISFRNGFLYSFFMPNIWTGAVFVFPGAGGFAVLYGLVKATVIFGAHSELLWDQYLYRSKWLSPLAWILERTIWTPATHFSHHAASEDYGVGHYSGNFGILLFLWDVLFGASLIIRKYPPAFGLDSDRVFGPERWFVQLFFPLFRSKRENSDFNYPILGFRGSLTETPSTPVR